jgi:hypothetical protein
MKVYAINYLDTDGCTYSCLLTTKVYAKKEDAETELTRLELIYIKAQENWKRMSNSQYFDWYSSLPDDDRDATKFDESGFRFSIEEIDVL